MFISFLVFLGHPVLMGEYSTNESAHNLCSHCGKIRKPEKSSKFQFSKVTERQHLKKGLVDSFPLKTLLKVSLEDFIF